MRKVALITYFKGIHDDYYGHQVIPTSITDWQEVSDDDYKLLMYGAAKNKWYVMEQPLDQGKTIVKCIDDGLKIIKAQAEREKQYKAEQERKKLQRLEKKKEKENKLYEKLKAKYDNDTLKS
jgi:hypothetical protein